VTHILPFFQVKTTLNPEIILEIKLKIRVLLCLNPVRIIEIISKIRVPFYPLVNFTMIQFFSLKPFLSKTHPKTS